MKQQYKIILQVGLGLLSVGLGIYFIRHERAELSKVKEALTTADPVWIIWGLLLLIVFMIVQGVMYQKSFEAIHEKIGLGTGISLYLKRNLISVFLPAGVLTNVLFFNEMVERKEGVSKTQIYFASTIFSVCSILTGIIVGLPALVWLLWKQSLSEQLVLGIVITTILIVVLVISVVRVTRSEEGTHFLGKRIPVVAQLMKDLREQSFDRQKFLQVVGLSLIVEIIGIAHLYIAVKALGGGPTLEMAIIGYAIVLLLLMSSPFLRGIGAVEAALTYSLTLFGLSTVLALSVAFLFRFFEFWGVLLMGVVALITQRDNLLVRVFPAFLLFLLGIVNIISGLTPAMPGRLEMLLEVIPMEAIHASTWLVILSGIIMLAISIYLLKGLRNAWGSALVLSGLSLVAHLVKGIDWEEALVALITFGSLIYQRHQYFIKPDLKLARRSLFPGMVAVAGVLLFGTIGFYWLNPVHFNVDFNLWESFKEAATTFLLINIDLVPATPFGKEFLLGMHLLGGLTLAYFAYLFLRPLIQHTASTEEEDREKAKALVERYGKGSLDYFKTYPDKRYWFNEDGTGFLAFKTSRNYAIVLENPVCDGLESRAGIIKKFDAQCRKSGLRTAYYRIPESDKDLYEKLGKKLLPVGEEAVLNLETWSTEGRDKKTIRNAVNKITKEGYSFKVNEPPQKDAFLQQLKAVSDEWLRDMERKEMVFSQGAFNEKELKQQTILSLENPEGKVIGFINLIPDYNAREANFDLMRKTGDAPNGTMDFLFVNMFEYLKSLGFKGCNLGMVPMSGIDVPENLQERVMKLAYERIRQFGHYKSLRSYKDKFEPNWQMMYLVYDAPFDLIYLPNALERVIEP